MKVHRKTILLFLSLTPLIALGNPIEFSADLQDFTGEGIVYHRLVFKEGKRTIWYQPPLDWRCSLNGNILRLAPPEKTFAEAEIAALPLDKPAAFNAVDVDALTKKVLAEVPPASQQPELVRQQENPIPFSGNPSVEIVVSYKLLGDTFQRSVLFVNTPANQLVFKFSARKGDFDKLYTAFRGSVSTWQWQPETAP